MTLASPASLWYTAIIFLASVRAVNSAITPVVDLGYAQYQGVFDTNLNVTSFLGIRYASAPTGKHRFSTYTYKAEAFGREFTLASAYSAFQGRWRSTGVQ